MATARSGEETAWEVLSGKAPAGVALRAQARHDSASDAYHLTCFGQEITVSVRDRSLRSPSPWGESMLTGNAGSHMRLAILHYLAGARDIDPTGDYISPAALPGGAMFVKGTHVLSMRGIEELFEADISRLRARVGELGGTLGGPGDLCARLRPFPRVALQFVVWRGDEDFPTKACLLFDRAGSFHLATDILWASAVVALELIGA